MTFKRVFLLGAGSSKEAGLPLGKELIDFILNKLKDSPNVLDRVLYEEISDFFKRIQIKYPWLTNDVELLFTYIDLALLRNSAGIFDRLGYSLGNLRER